MKFKLQSTDMFPSIVIDKCLFEQHTTDTTKINTMCVSFPFLCEECLDRITNLKYNYVMQSADMPAESAPLVPVTEENVDFHDENAGLETGFYREVDSNSTLDETPLDLAKFLSRPVKIANFTWLESDPVGTVRTFSPWDLFFNDTRIKKKLDNFAFLQCDLKVKVMINASPFYYGAMLMNYVPLPNLTPSTAPADSGLRYFIPISQRPHLWISPQHNSGGDMVLPYFNFRNWLRMQIRQDFLDMGTLNLVNFTVLDSANGVSSSGATVTIYAWAENVKISGPTVGLSLQSADEYGEGVISKPASAIAYVASALENAPFIGKFATVTRIGATAISSIASLFGFTNVPVIEDTMPYRPSPYPQFSSTDIGYPVEKLTVDAKNELSVDPSIVGLPSKDELIISNLIGKESYLTAGTWTTALAPDAILFTSVVTPHLFAASAVANPLIYSTPASWVAQLFKAWRGDMIFRFKFICSQYHKGRVRISYDPAGTVAQNLTADPLSSTVVFTQIVDLNKDTDVEIRIPYQQAISWLLTNAGNYAVSPWSIGSSPTYVFDPGFHNGTIQVRVLNALTAPVATSTIKMFVFVRGADNLEFANPAEPPNNISPFVVQSADVYGEPTTVTVGASRRPNSEKYLVNWGESIMSLRTLMRRTNLSTVWCEPTSIVDDKYTVIRQRFTKWPPYYGYDPAGLNSAKGLLVPASNFNFNYCQTTVYNWVAPAFIGQRGSMIWTFNVDSNTTQNSVKIIRVPQNTGNAINTVTTFVGGTQSADARFFRNSTQAQASGSALTSQQTQSGLSVLCPNYNPYRFQTTTPTNATAPTSVDASDQDNILLEISPTTGNTPTDTTIFKIWKYASIGTDFNLHFFLNVPVLYQLSAVPVAN
jgi:hypothetical protein